MPLSRGGSRTDSTIHGRRTRMRTHLCLFGLSTATLALVLSLLPAASGAADDESDKELKATILKLADAIEQDDTAAVKKQLEALKKTDVDDLMGLSKLRSKG